MDSPVQDDTVSSSTHYNTNNISHVPVIDEREIQVQEVSSTTSSDIEAFLLSIIGD